jgi:hypothetical protein
MNSSLTYLMQLLRGREARGAESDTNLVNCVHIYIYIYIYIYIFSYTARMCGVTLSAQMRAYDYLTSKWW